MPTDLLLDPADAGPADVGGLASGTASASPAPQLTVWGASLDRPPGVDTDVANLIAALLAPASALLTGTTTMLDGGHILPL